MNPKDRFNKTPQAKVFADMAVSEPFLLALDYAILELQASMNQDDDPGKGWAAHNRMSGASQFVKILLNLPFPNEQTKPVHTPTLNYDAYNRPARPGSRPVNPGQSTTASQ